MGARTVRLNIISIHAPPRGATPQAPTPQLGGIFQFTPLREGRPFVAFRQRLPCKFQFTPLREGRRTPAAQAATHKPISIHAPPRGATKTATKRKGRKKYFNSRPSARGDSTRSARTSPDPFQFTPLREGRRVRPRTWLPAHRHFNSRPSARGDG